MIEPGQLLDDDQAIEVARSLARQHVAERDELTAQCANPRAFGNAYSTELFHLRQISREAAA